MNNTFIKKVISILTAAVMLVALLPTCMTASAQIIRSGTCGENLTWELDDNYVLTISGTGDMTDYQNIVYVNCPWGSYPKQVIINSGVTSIGNYAFYPCDKLTSVTLPDTLKRIGDYALAYCSMESVAIPDGVTRIGDGAFYFCQGLTELTIPDSVTYIGKTAFGQCANIRSITLPKHITELSDYVLSDCRGLKTITIPDSVISIGKCAFFQCSFTEVTIPEGVTTIKDEAFRHCLSLKKVTIPESVTNFGEKVFQYYNSDGTYHTIEGLTLYVFPGSAAHRYAIANKIKYELLRFRGDADGDEKVTVADALVSLRAAVGLTALDDASLAAADIDGDGIITVSDALRILRIAAKL